jgi:CRP/FNR family cyclic AMP-dependent transcriptional regulator
MQKIQLFNQDKDAKQFTAGSSVFKEGDVGEQMYAVLDGSVDIIIHGQTVETIEAGGVFGEMALIEDRPRIASALVKSDARLVTIDRKRFMNVVQHNPFFALQLMGVMAGRLRKMDEKL